MRSSKSTSTGVPISSSCVAKNTFEPEVAKVQQEIPGTSKHDSFGLKYLQVTSRFRRPSKHGDSTYTSVSAHLSNTAAKRRDVAMQLLGQLRNVAEKNGADIIAGDFNTSACCERGKAKVSSIVEAWEETLLIPPPDFVPVWGQMEDSGDCCGFKTKKNHVPNWRVAGHGRPSLQLKKEKMHTKETDQAAHLLIYIHFCEARAAERIARGEPAKQYRRTRGVGRRR